VTDRKLISARPLVLDAARVIASAARQLEEKLAKNEKGEA